MKNKVVIENQKYVIVSEKPNLFYKGRTELWMHKEKGTTAYIASRLSNRFITSPVGMWGMKAR
jgi:hypothetical protein